MRIDQFLPAALVNASRTAPAVQALLVGQMLSVRVLERVDPASVRISIGGVQAVAETNLDLEPGAELTVRVASLGAKPQLAVVAPGDGDGTELAAVGSALKAALPRQEPVQTVMQRLAEAPGRTVALPAGIAAVLGTLLEELPGLDELSRPPALREAVLRSGPGLEAALAAAAQTPGSPFPQRDLKWRLFELRTAISQASPTATSNPGDSPEPAPVRFALTAPTYAHLAPARGGTPPGLPAGVPAVPPDTVALPPLPDHDPDATSGAARAPAPNLGTPSAAGDGSRPMPAVGAATAEEEHTRVAPQAGSPADGEIGPPAQGDDGHPAPATLRMLAADVEAGLARIATHQLQQVTAGERGDLLIQLEVPFRHQDGPGTLQIEIEERQRGAHAREDPPLEIELSLPLPSLGEFRARLALQGNHLGVTLWSEAPALRNLMLERVAELEGSLSGAGFELSPVGVRELAPTDGLRGLPAGLVDTTV